MDIYDIMGLNLRTFSLSVNRSVGKTQPLTTSQWEKKLRKMVKYWILMITCVQVSRAN